MNWYILFISGIVPLLIGMIWYSKMGFGNAWMQASGMKEEDAKEINMPLVFGLTYVFGVMLSSVLMGLVIHQMGVFSTLANEDPSVFTDFMAKYGTNFRTFKHGMLHGAIGGLFLGLPIVGMSALFEKRGFKYIAIHVGFWMVSMILMGGIICQWG